MSPLVVGSVGVLASGLAYAKYKEEHDAKNDAFRRSTVNADDANARACLATRQATEKDAFKVLVIVAGGSLAATLAALALRR